MASLILRRRSSLLSPTRILTALSSVETVNLRLYHARSIPSFKDDRFSFVSSLTEKGLHTKSGPLNYRASYVVQAEYAVADSPSYNEEKGSKGVIGSGGDEGLEIAKLGISQEIVDALSKKGITKLFPIQVYFEKLEGDKCSLAN